LTRLDDDLSIEIVGHGYDIEREFYIIDLAREFSVQPQRKEYRLDLTYQAAFNDQLRGMYYRYFNINHFVK
jgi:hypothetical protein